MTHSSTLLSDILHASMTGRLGDLLLLWFDAGVNYGGGLPLERPKDATIDALLTQTIDRWHDESGALSDWREAYDDKTLTTDELPGWLLSLPNQAEADHGGA